MKISANAFIHCSKTDFKKYFQTLLNDPKKYSFGSHKGFIPIKGDIADKGSTFKTKERFLFFFINLFFETIEADEESHLKFWLTKPLRQARIVGEFSYEVIDKKEILLTLTVTNVPANFFSKFLASLVFYTPIRLLVKNQITKEVKFIKQSVEKGIL
jgi:hypothetical protein